MTAGLPFARTTVAAVVADFEAFFEQACLEPIVVEREDGSAIMTVPFAEWERLARFASVKETSPPD